MDASAFEGATSVTGHCKKFQVCMITVLVIRSVLMRPAMYSMSNRQKEGFGALSREATRNEGKDPRHWKGPQWKERRSNSCAEEQRQPKS